MSPKRKHQQKCRKRGGGSPCGNTRGGGGGAESDGDQEDDCRDRNDSDHDNNDDNDHNDNRHNESVVTAKMACFDDRKCHYPKTDHRYRLYTELKKSVSKFDERAVLDLIRRHPKCMHYKYRFPYYTEDDDDDDDDDDNHKGNSPGNDDNNVPTQPQRPQPKVTKRNPPMVYSSALSRIASVPAASLDLMKAAYEAFPDAIRKPDKPDAAGNGKKKQHAGCGGRLPLHYACRYAAADSGADEKVAWLVSRYPDAVRTKSDRGVLPFHYACGTSVFALDTIRYLASLYPECVAATADRNWTPLHFACMFHDDENVVSFLIRSAPEACRVRASNGHYPLHHACLTRFRSSLRIVRELVDAYPDAVRQTNWAGYTPLHSLLVSYSNKGIVSKQPIVYEGIASKQPIVYGDTDDVLEYLIQCYPEAVRRQTKGGKINTALHFACCRGLSVRGIALLLKAYPESIDVRTPRDILPIDLAQESGASAEVVKFLSLFTSFEKGILEMRDEAERNDFIDNLVEYAHQHVASEPKPTIPEAKGGHEEEKALATFASQEQTSQLETDVAPADITSLDESSIHNTAAEQMRCKREQMLLLGKDSFPANEELVPGAVRVRGINQQSDNSSRQSSFDNGEPQSLDTNRFVDNPGGVAGFSSALGPIEAPPIIAAEVAPDVLELENEIQRLRKSLEQQQQQQQQQRQQKEEDLEHRRQSEHSLLPDPGPTDQHQQQQQEQQQRTDILEADVVVSVARVISAEAVSASNPKPTTPRQHATCCVVM